MTLTGIYMEDLIIFRMFLTLPIIGTFLPDVGMLFSTPPNTIPLSHIIVAASLLTSIVVCSAGINRFKRKVQY